MILTLTWRQFRSRLDAGILTLPMMAAVCVVLNLPALFAQAPAAKFDVVSVRPCNAGDIAASGNGRGAEGGRISWSPGRVSAECQTVENLIRDAYLRYADGKPLPLLMPGRHVPSISDRTLGQPIRASGAAWINADLYTIEAKEESLSSEEMARGPMMQAVLAERFQLKLHKETREVPVYELTASNNGIKLKVAQTGSCIPLDGDHPRAPLPGPGQPIPGAAEMRCGLFIPSARNEGIDINGTTLDSLCRNLSVVFDRDVVNKTGIAGLFDLHLDISREPSSGEVPTGTGPDGPRALEPGAMVPAFQAAVRKLGLKLEPGKGSGEFIVIDHVERPSEN